MSAEVVGKILVIRVEYQPGALRVTYYLDRYYGVKSSKFTVTRVLRATEAADALKIPIGTVKSRLARARLRLSEKLCGTKNTPLCLSCPA